MCLVQMEKIENISDLYYQDESVNFFFVVNSFPRAFSLSNYSVIFEDLKNTIPE